MNKVVKLALISKTEKDGKEIPYKDICRVLWDLQRATREIKNKTIQYCWEWQGFASEYKKQNGEFPKEREFLKKTDPETGDLLKDYALESYIYDKVKDFPLYSINIATCSRAAVKDFKNACKEILRGDKSILNYKFNQPIDLHNRSVKLDFIDGKFHVLLSLLNSKSKKEYGIDCPFKFEVVVKDKSTRTILERCIDSVYGISASKLIYNQKKKQWFLNLSYSFEKEADSLDKDKILGVDLGIAYPLVASVNGDYARLLVRGDEIKQFGSKAKARTAQISDCGSIEAFRRKTEARKRAIRKQRPMCGDGSCGHGYKTRMRPANIMADKVARFRDTFNHKASRALIDYAVKNGCGVIQMEDLTGITKEANAFLKNWPYYDLQQKIEYKAKEAGISVVYVAPQFTSQRCSKCGAIHKDSRPEQAKFLCTECGFEANADYNASQNIALKGITDIISEYVKVHPELKPPKDKETEKKSA